MALNIQTGDVTQPGATGNADITLPANFDPVAVIMVAVPVTADGIVAHASMSVGFGTYRGAAVQHRCLTNLAEDNIGTSDTYREMKTDSILALCDITGANDLKVELVSMTTGSGSKITINWQNLHTTASIRIFYIAFGGSDVVDAEAHNFTQTTGAGALDVALSSGMGHPDVVFFGRVADVFGGVTTPGADWALGFGVRGTVGGRCIWWGSADAAATEASFQRITNNSALISGANGTIETDFDLAAESGWPTDGYEITKATASFSEPVCALAIRFSGNVVITHGESAMRTTTGDTDHAVGSSAPKGFILLHTRQATANSTDSTSADAAEMGIGFIDDAGNERWAGCWDDDAQATASVASSAQAAAKALRVYTPSTDALDGEADGLVSGSNFRLTTTDAFSAAFLYEWIAFGITSASAASRASTRRDREVTALGQMM